MKIVGNSVDLNKTERQFLKSLIDKRYGKKTTPIDYISDDTLPGIEQDIYNKIREKISGSTLERIVGLTKDQGKIRQDTLEIVAKYLNFKNSSELINHIVFHSSKDTSYFDPFSPIKFLKNHTLTLDFEKGIKILLKQLDENKFEVLDCVNSKLIKSDIIEVSQLAVEQELICENVIRIPFPYKEKMNLGRYGSGSQNLVKSILLTHIQSFT